IRIRSFSASLRQVQATLVEPVETPYSAMLPKNCHKKSGVVIETTPLFICNFFGGVMPSGRLFQAKELL
ncbi:hypothetical protein QUF58_14515, partial [Anaerolineales bacterium HSG24]|nr:hypothetical protein [Anaerolineales bacterium HSG24]